MLSLFLPNPGPQSPILPWRAQSKVDKGRDRIGAQLLDWLSCWISFLISSFPLLLKTLFSLSIYLSLCLFSCIFNSKSKISTFTLLLSNVRTFTPIILSQLMYYYCLFETVIIIWLDEEIEALEVMWSALSHTVHHWRVFSIIMCLILRIWR